MALFAQSTSPPWWAFLLFFLALLGLALFARNRDAEYARQLLASDWAARVLGLFVIAMGLGAAYLLAYEPIAGANAGGRTLLVHRGAVGVPSVIVFAGLILLIAGRHSGRFFAVGHGYNQTLTPLQWALVVIGCAIALGSELGFEAFLRARGFARFR